MRIYLFLFFLFSCFSSYTQKAVNPGYYINSTYEEREPIPSPDGRTLYFWRREMPGNTGGIGDPGDIWFSNRTSTGWTRAVKMRPPLNSNGHDFVWQVSPYQDTLWVMQVPPGVREGGMAYSVRTAEGYWSSPEKIHIRGFQYQGQYKDFFLTRDRHLILPNEGKNTYGGTDIYVCFPINDTAWSAPVNLGPTINTIGDEDAAFIAADGRTLYFNSNGHGGEGDHDIFMSQRLDNTWRNWSSPVNIGPPVNTPGYDFDFYISADEKTLFWCTDNKTLGSNDIYYMDLDVCSVDIYPSGDQTLCEGQNITLEAGFTTGRSLSYQWLKDGIPIRGAVNRSLRVQSSGRYQLVRTKDRCRDTSAVQNIRFVPAPEAKIATQNDVLCLDDSVQLNASVQPGLSYQWVRNNTVIPDANQASLWVKTPGTYSLRVSAGSCSSQSPALNLRRFTPPGIYTAADTINGLLPILPRWLWTSKIPKRKGVPFIKDMTTTPNGSIYMLTSLEKRGKYIDYIDGYFPQGLFRISFVLEKRDENSDRFIASDPEGNLIVADNDNYLTKFYPDGRIIWQKHISRQKMTGLAVDPLGYIYSMGRFEGEMYMAGDSYVAAQRGGMFLAKHSPRGEIMWVRNFAVDWYKFDFGNALHTDCEGNLYIAGGFETIANFEKEVLRGAFTGENYFLAKFSPDGELFWARRINTESTRLRTHDVHTDCDGNTYLILNRQIFRFDTYGTEQWKGRLRMPAGGVALSTRIYGSQGDAYISGYTDRGDYFVTKLNRLNKQVIIWQDKGASNSEFDLPAITGDTDGAILIGGVGKGNNFPGAQLDLTSNSTAFLLKYGKPDIRMRREPMSLCDPKGITLYTPMGAGLHYQWIRNGKDIPGAIHSSLEVREPGTYQVRAFSDNCSRISEYQQITACGDDPMAAPPITAPDLASNKGKTPVISPKTIPEEKPKSNPEPAPSEIEFRPDGLPRKLKKRRVKTQEEIVIRNPQAKIIIWDHAAEDRDTVSINVNGQWLVEEYGLKKDKREFTYTFKPGNNFIMLYAHNLGATPPNTAAIMVDDGTNQKTLVLRSNLRNCGMLKVKLE